MQSYCCQTLQLHKLFLTLILLSRLQSLNFHLKVFHPQNCVYSIIADIKRYTLENRTANEANRQSEQNGRFMNPILFVAHTLHVFLCVFWCMVSQCYAHFIYILMCLE